VFVRWEFERSGQLVEEFGRTFERGKGAFLAEIEQGIEAEAGGAHGLEQVASGRGLELGGGRKEDEGLVEPGEQGGKDVEEFARAGLNGEEDRKSLERADLKGVVAAGPSELVLEAEGSAKSSGKFGPVEHERDDVIGQEAEGGAGAAAADAEHGAVGLADDFVEATAAVNAGDELHRGFGDGFEESGFESRVMALEVVTPDWPDSYRTRERFEEGPRGRLFLEN